MAKHAVLLGANGASWGNPLSYAESDAVRLSDVLSLPHCGYTVDLIPGSADPSESLRRIDGAAAKCKADDIFLLHISCHGEVIKSELYLVLDGTQLQNIQGTGLPAERVVGAFKRCRAQNKLLVFDCCRAAAALGTTSRSEIGVPITDLIPPENHQIIFASDRFEDSLEFDRLGAGFLSYSLTSALAWEFDEADTDGDGALSTDDLRIWIERSVTEFNQRSTRPAPIPHWASTKQQGTFILAERPGSGVTLPKRPGPRLDRYLKHVLLDRRSLAVAIAVALFGGMSSAWYLKPSASEIASRKCVARYTNQRKIVIGCKRYPEQELLLELMATVIELSHPQLSVERNFDFKRGETTDVFVALCDGEIDLYAEYTGTLLAQLLERPPHVVRDPKSHSVAFINQILKSRARTQRLLWLGRFGFNNTYVLTMLRQRAKELGILRPNGTVSISDLATVSTRLTFRSETQFQTRPDGLPGLQSEYKLHFKETEYIRHRNKYKSLLSRETDVAPGYSTDPELFLENRAFVSVEDNKNFFPAYFASPFVRRELKSYLPAVIDSLLKLENAISEADIAELITHMQVTGIIKENLKISTTGRAGLHSIAKQFLLDKKIIELV